MNPTELMGGFVGGLAVFMIFALPIVAIVGTLIVIGTGVRARHRERMRMIEQGILPPPPRKRKGNYFALLITGAIFLAFGIGMFLVGNISDEGDMTPGLIFGFVGLAMVACFIVIRRLNRKDRELDHNGRDEGPPALSN